VGGRFAIIVVLNKGVNYTALLHLIFGVCSSVTRGFLCSSTTDTVASTQMLEEALENDDSLESGGVFQTVVRTTN